MSAHLKKHLLTSAEDHDLTGLNGVLQTQTDTNGTTSLTAIDFSTMLSNQTTLYSKAEVDDLIASGIWKNNTSAALADHAAIDASKTAVGKAVIDLTDNKVYKVTAISGSTVTFDAGYKPTTPEIRVDEDTDATWVYDVEGDSWANQGASSHSRTHAMTSASDHSAGAEKIFYSDGNGEVKELALGPAGTVLQANGAGNAPTFAAPSLAALANTIANAAGAAPADADMANDAVGAIKLFAGTGGNLFIAVKTASGVKSVELA